MKHTLTGFISYRREVWQPEGEFIFTSIDMQASGYTEYQTVMPFAFDVDVPDSFDPRAAQVAALKAAKMKVMADFQARITDIDRQISELTALEFAA